MAEFSVDTFIHNAANIRDLNTLVRLFKDMFASFNFEAITYYSVRDAFRSKPMRQGARIRSESDLFEALFAPDQPLDFDPAIGALLDKMEPFHWFDPEKNENASEELKFISNALRSDGYIDGISIPVMTRPGELSVFNFSKRGVEFNISKVQLRKLQIACQAMHLRFGELSKSSSEVLLSERETEVMSLVANGKTNKEIARNLSLSSHTVDTLIRRSFKKFGVTNRIEASIMYTFQYGRTA